MKKLIMLAVILMAVGGLAFAQIGWETATITGTVGLRSGAIVVESGGVTYHTPDLGRYSQLIDGLRVGAQVSVEGYLAPPVLPGATERILHPVRLTIGGNVYEVGVTATAINQGFACCLGTGAFRGGMSGWGHHGGWGGMGRRGRW